ncbi:MAG: SPOR domain-containing protein, partial [Moraxellaceae bacterium]
LLDGDEKPWMVQAGMAANLEAAEAMAAKLKAQGYKVQTSQTNRGVRVLVGPEKGQAAAKALSAKINQDPRVNVDGAWAIDWQPLAEAAGRQSARPESRRADSSSRQNDAARRESPDSKPARADKPVTAAPILMVQVAMAADQARAEAVVAKLKASGYSAKTSQTSRGVRIMVGPARDRDAALALRNKVNQDPKLGTTSAWVINWQPPTP